MVKICNLRRTDKTFHFNSNFAFAFYGCNQWLCCQINLDIYVANVKVQGIVSNCPSRSAQRLLYQTVKEIFTSHYFIRKC